MHQAIPPPALSQPPPHLPKFQSADRLTGGITETHTQGLTVSAILRTSYRTYYAVSDILFMFRFNKTEHNFKGHKPMYLVLLCRETKHTNTCAYMQ